MLCFYVCNNCKTFKFLNLTMDDFKFFCGICLVNNLFLQKHPLKIDEKSKIALIRTYRIFLKVSIFPNIFKFVHPWFLIFFKFCSNHWSSFFGLVGSQNGIIELKWLVFVLSKTVYLLEIARYFSWADTNIWSWKFLQFSLKFYGISLSYIFLICTMWFGGWGCLLESLWQNNFCNLFQSCGKVTRGQKNTSSW